MFRLLSFYLSMLLFVLSVLYLFKKLESKPKFRESAMYVLFLLWQNTRRCRVHLPSIGSHAYLLSSWYMESYNQ